MQCCYYTQWNSIVERALNINFCIFVFFFLLIYSLCHIDRTIFPLTRECQSILILCIKYFIRRFSICFEASSVFGRFLFSYVFCFSFPELLNNHLTWLSRIRLRILSSGTGTQEWLKLEHMLRFSRQPIINHTLFHNTDYGNRDPIEIEFILFFRLSYFIDGSIDWIFIFSHSFVLNTACAYKLSSLDENKIKIQVNCISISIKYSLIVWILKMTKTIIHIDAWNFVDLLFNL